MSNIPFITRETSCSSRRIYQMRHEHFRVHMSEEEKIAAEESLQAYCKPIEFYNILQHRAKKNPLFLQRSLNYQIEAKHQRRIQMTLSLSDTIDAGIQTQTPLPLFVLLARLVSPKPTAECDAVYKFSRACILTGVRGVNGVSQAQAKFLLPDMNKLALEAKSGSLAILFISFSGGQNSQFGIGSSNIHSGGNCLWSKIPLESLYSSWQEYPNMDLGQKANSVSLVEMQQYNANANALPIKACVKYTSVNEEYQVVNVSLKSETMITEIQISEEDLNARPEPYFFSTKKSRRKRQKSHVGNSRQGRHLGLGCEVLDRTDDNFGLFQVSNCKRPSSSESHT
ncbi:hypothetical protein Bca101_017228 [Brassica carinata]